jgi:hypothetical protein
MTSCDYRDDDVQRMTSRFDRRSMDTKIRLLRGLLSTAIIHHGDCPTYEGGPSLARWVVETVSYFAVSRYPRARVENWMRAGADLY